MIEFIQFLFTNIIQCIGNRGRITGISSNNCIYQYIAKNVTLNPTHSKKRWLFIRKILFIADFAGFPAVVHFLGKRWKLDKNASISLHSNRNSSRLDWCILDFCGSRKLAGTFWVSYTNIGFMSQNVPIHT